MGFKESSRKAIFEIAGKTCILSKPDFANDVGVTLGFLLKRGTIKRGISSIAQESHL